MRITRREALAAGLMAGAAGVQAVQPAHSTAAIMRRRIPKTGELLPAIGMGSYRTFDVDPTGDMTAQIEVMRTFLDHGGSLIDSSPMYKRSEAALGAVLDALSRHDLFFATKVWTADGRDAGIAQMRTSIELMQAPVMDLMQVHNLVDWQTHLRTMREWKAAGTIRYIGITEMRDFETVERLMRDEDLDFIQIPYNVLDRRVEERVLPAAIDTGTAVLVMRPFGAGQLFPKVRGRELPEWAAAFDCHSWAQFFLKFVLAHPGVTCPIPATSKAHHMADNMGAGIGRLPDAGERARMIEVMES